MINADNTREWIGKNFRDFVPGCKLAGIAIDEPSRIVSLTIKITSKRALKSSST